LAAIPDVVELPEDQLIYLLHNSSRMLTGLHAHEVLSGLFLDAQVHAPTGAELAAAEIARGRADGLDDAAIMARYPVAMVLLPPRIGPARPLPHSASTRFSVLRGREADDPQVALAVSREVLRIRVRWTQELMARAAMEIGARLHRHGQLRRPADIRHLRLSTVVDMVLDYELKPDLEPAAHQPGPPLPEVFRVAPDGTVVADTRGAGAVQGVSGGRTIAEITHDPGNAAGRILATEALHPALAAVLPEVAGIVSQSGSPLSHLAILARERGVPVVIGFTDVRAMFPEGLLVLLDGTNGTAEKYSLDSAERS
ncbi:MAG: pyruvate, phosphate dikinase, partial [Mycobacteriaceae bacterium]|nr:pyruvate, phosphate dikinase [Mycobacteriaceae bacterium]